MSRIYLESTDSIRAAWGDDDNHDAAAVHLFTEALLSIAFGRQLVVQQSAALDSWVCQEMIRDVGEAWRCVDADNRGRHVPRPVLLHLHGADTFRLSVVNALRRAGRPPVGQTGVGPRPFHSSLYPELNQVTQAEALRIATMLDEQSSPQLLLERLDPERAGLFEALWRWFGPANRGVGDYVVATAAREYPSVDDLLVPLLSGDKDLDVRLQRAGLRDHVVTGQVTEALRSLQRARGGTNPFSERSSLRAGWTWAGKDEAADVVGREALGLVREVVDTLYNRVVCDSIGSVDGLYSTPMSQPADAEAVLVAQSVALHTADHARGLPFGALGTAGDEHPDIAVVAPDATAAKELVAALLVRAPAAYASVVAAGLEKPWRDSLGEIEEARLTSDAPRFEAAVAAHQAKLAEVLSGVLRADQAPIPGAPLVLGATSAGGAISAGVGVAASSGLVLTLAGALTAGGLAAVGLAFERVQQARTGPSPRAIKRAMGEIVVVRRPGSRP